MVGITQSPDRRSSTSPSPCSQRRLDLSRHPFTQIRKFGFSLEVPPSWSPTRRLWKGKSRDFKDSRIGKSSETRCEEPASSESRCMGKYWSLRRDVSYAWTEKIPGDLMRACYDITPMDHPRGTDSLASTLIHTRGANLSLTELPFSKLIRRCRLAASPKSFVVRVPSAGYCSFAYVYKELDVNSS